MLLGLLQPAMAQVHCFAEISLDRTQVYVQQPFKVTITVLTATWYTEPLDFENIQIPNAFTLPFDQTTPGMYNVQGKQYAGLQFYYIVFPYQAGEFTLPPIHITATTPPEGSAVAAKVKISTPARHFTVKPVPDKLKGANWLVAKNIFISEHWNRSLHHLKAGDIIERTITIQARGTLPQFIPPLQREELSFAHTYLQEAELDDERNDYDANGKLRQTITYLLEKEGDFELPAINIDWWNPLNSRLYKKTAAGVRIHVAANPNLGMIATIRDSLSATETTHTTRAVKKGPYTIAGIPWYWCLIYLLAASAVLYWLLKGIGRAVQAVKTRRRAYLQSEPFWFRRLLHLSNSPTALVHHLYPWWDRLPPHNKRSSVTDALQQEQQTELQQQWQQFNSQVFDGKTGQPAHRAAKEGSLFTSQLKSFRTTLTRYRKQRRLLPASTNERSIGSQQLPWI